MGSSTSPFILTRLRTMTFTKTLSLVVRINDIVKDDIMCLETNSDEAMPFCTGYYTIGLRQIGQSLTDGDEIPIIVKATLIHSEERLTLKREVIAKYSGSLT